jgi:copper chaperone
MSNPVISELFLVEGMTCSHCVASVTEEVSAIAGVESVAVDLEVGGASRVTVISDAPIPVETVLAAVNEAGYPKVTVGR